MNDDKLSFSNTDKILIVGKSGSGKTVLMRALIEANEPIFTSLVQQKYGVTKQFIKIDPLCQFGGQFIRYGDRVSYDRILTKMFTSPPEFIVTDEADQFFPSKVTLSNVENDFIQIGRPSGLGGMFISRRLAQLNINLVSNANKIFIFKLWAGADLKYLANCNFKPEVIDIVSRLEPYHFLCIDVDKNDYTVYDPI